MEAAPKLKH